jgi:hypothetical protein
MWNEATGSGRRALPTEDLACIAACSRPIPDQTGFHSQASRSNYRTSEPIVEMPRARDRVYKQRQAGCGEPPWLLQGTAAQDARPSGEDGKILSCPCSNMRCDQHVAVVNGVTTSLQVDKFTLPAS